MELVTTGRKGGCKLIGVQPKETGLDSEMSEECRNSIGLVKELVKQNL